MKQFDVIVVGGGPAGSTCASVLAEAGIHVAVLDRAVFPRGKLCAGWLSAPVWDALERSPNDYPGGLWEWQRCHVHFRGSHHIIKAHGYFIRRTEFDHWLLSTSGAAIITHSAKEFERDGDSWIVDGKFRARTLVGAGGTHCPVARALLPAKTRKPIAAKEIEFPVAPDALSHVRIGEDGEPELLLHDNLGGYSWNIAKTGWSNVGSGTLNPKKVRQAWERAQTFFERQQHLPPNAGDALGSAKGHSYYLFDPSNLRGCHHDNVFSVGDALGLAQPLTAEGILPAILSGRLCANAIVAGEPSNYRSALQASPVISDYDMLFRMWKLGSRARRGVAQIRSKRATSMGVTQAKTTALEHAVRKSGPLKKSPSAQQASTQPQPPSRQSRLTGRIVASGFAWMFSGRPLPTRLVHPLLRKLFGNGAA